MSGLPGGETRLLSAGTATRRIRDLAVKAYEEICITLLDHVSISFGVAIITGVEYVRHRFDWAHGAVPTAMLGTLTAVSAMSLVIPRVADILGNMAVQLMRTGRRLKKEWNSTSTPPKEDE